MVLVGEFHRGVRQGTAAAAGRDDVVGHGREPGRQFGAGIAGMGRGQTVPFGIGLPGELAQAFGDEEVLGRKMTVERHLVGGDRRLGSPTRNARRSPTSSTRAWITS